MSTSLAKFARTLVRFKKSEQGVTAVEFGLIAMPFFALTFGLAEVAMVGFAQTSLNFAVAEAGRQVRTGQAQMAGASYSQMQTDICADLNNFIVVNCVDTLYLDVHRYDSFIQAASQPNPLQNGEFNDEGFGYEPGAPSDIVVVRAYYRWHVLTPLFEHVLGNVSTGERVLVSTMMFRNEPYQ